MPVFHDSHVEVNRVELKNVNVGPWGGYLVMHTDTDVTFKTGFVAGQALHKVQHVMSLRVALELKHGGVAVSSVEIRAVQFRWIRKSKDFEFAFRTRSS